MRAHRATFLGLAGSAMLVIGLVIGLQPQGGGGDPDDRGARAAATSTLPEVRHVFVINIENKGFHATWGSGSAAPYLAKTLRAKGVLLTQYYGTAHHSLGNYLAQISGQGPNYATQHDCPVYTRFKEIRPVQAPGQVVGDGCVYPKKVAHPARPADGGGARLARLHARHVPALPAPPAGSPRPLDDGDDAAAVRHPAQPVRLLPLDHRRTRRTARRT